MFILKIFLWKRLTNGLMRQGLVKNNLVKKIIKIFYYNLFSKNIRKTHN